MSQAFAQTRFVFTEIQLTLTRYQSRKRINVTFISHGPFPREKFNARKSREAFQGVVNVCISHIRFPPFPLCHSR